MINGKLIKGDHVTALGTNSASITRKLTAHPGTRNFPVRAVSPITVTRFAFWKRASSGGSVGPGSVIRGPESGVRIFAAKGNGCIERVVAE